MRKLTLIILTLVLSVFYAFSQETDTTQVKQLFGLSLDELININVKSVSNVEETIADAPATVIVITKEEIEQRGYTDLVQIFNDLPGIDLSITYGDLYFKPYWRGYRKGMPSPFLFMIDGMIMNHLWFNWTDVMTAVPLSNIERIEVVYGPASSVYGANALMGVFQIITKNDMEENGVSVNTKLTAGSLDTRVIDMNYFYKKDDFRLSVTTLFNHGDLDKKSLENYEYTKSKYLTDRSLWGGFLDNNNIAGVASSPRNNQGISLNSYYKNLEVGVQYFISDNGYGVNYAFDRVQPLAKWVEPDLNIYFKETHRLTDKINFNSLVHYRQSNVDNSSNTLEYMNGFGQERYVSFVYWQSLNRSWSVYEDFDIKLTKDFTIKTGMKFEQKDLQRKYELPRGPIVHADSIDLFSYEFPDPSIQTFKSENRLMWNDLGMYLQGRYSLSQLLKTENSNNVNIGLRYDNNTEYGSNFVIRAGYVGQFGKFRYKLLYGESFQEPTPRQLYAGWAGNTNNPELTPEYSTTFETNLSYTTESFSVMLNPYYNNLRNVIKEFEDTLFNSGKMDVFGADLHVQKLFKVPLLKQFKLWGYYSFLYTEEFKIDEDGVKTGIGEIGDLANHKIYFGTTSVYNNINVTIFGRYIGERKTVESNPVDMVDDWITVDINVMYRNFLAKGLNVSLKVSNLLDTQYYHPGIRAANAGTNEGYWDGNFWYGSRGWSNSLLPQPRRSFTFSLQYNL